MLVDIPFLVYYLYKGIINPIKEYLINEMKKNGYLEEDNINKPITKINSKLFDGSEKKDNKEKYLKKLHPPKKINNTEKRKINIKNSSIKNIKSTVKKNLSPNKFFNNKRNINKMQIKDIKNDLNNSKSESKEKELSLRANDSSSVNQFKILQNFPTQGAEKEKQIIEENNKDNKDDYNINYNLININLNNIKDYTPKSSFHILNIYYNFEEAINYDMRPVLAIFYIILLSKEAAFHAFLYRSPLSSFPLRLILLIFIISSDLALNAFFYLDDIISEKYKYAKGLFLFTFNNNITIIIVSTLIGFIFMTLFTNLSNSTNAIRDIFLKEEEKLKENKKYSVTQERKKEILEEIEKILRKHKIKVIILIVIQSIFILFFWYYVTAFCHVYSSTQTSWLFDSFLSMLSRLFLISIISLGFAKLYRMGIESNFFCIYKFVLFFYSFG